MVEYEETADHHCKGRANQLIGAAMIIGKDTQAVDIEACLTACTNDDTCNGVSVVGVKAGKCFLRTGLVSKKSSAKRTCYEKKIAGNNSSFFGTLISIKF